MLRKTSLLLASFGLWLNAKDLVAGRESNCTRSRLGLAVVDAPWKANGDSLLGICTCFHFTCQ